MKTHDVCLCPGLSQTSCHGSSSLILMCVLYNQTVMISIVISLSLWVIPVNDGTLRKCGKPLFCIQLVRSTGDLRTPNFVADI
jgi:hypothetical protein